MTATETMTRHELSVIVEPDDFSVDWTPASQPIDSARAQWEEALYQRFRVDRYRALLHLGLEPRPAASSDALKFLGDWAHAYVAQLAQVENLTALKFSVTVTPADPMVTAALDAAPYLVGQEHVTAQWLKTLWARLDDAFHQDMRGYSGTPADYFAAHHADRAPMGRIHFHLVENKNGQAPFAFMATYSPDASRPGAHVPLKNALVEYEHDHAKLLAVLSTVGRAAESSLWVAALLESGEIFHPLALTSQEAYTFLKEVPLYESAGILCRIPKWWKTRPRVRTTLTIGETRPSQLGREALLDFNAGLALGDQSLTAEDVQQLLAETEGLAFIKGQWVEVDHDALQKLLAAYESIARRSPQVTLAEAMRLELYGAQESPAADADGWTGLEITQGQWLTDFLQRLREAEPSPERLPFGDGLHATLRPYQEQGVAWLARMRAAGLGACLADDMGLGKTLQVLALFSWLRQTQPLRALVVVPASLLGNWLDEMHQFTPTLTGRIVHPSTLDRDDRVDSAWLCETDVVLTTYGMVQRYDAFHDVDWDMVVLDEAQAIKNPATRQAQAVKSLPAQFKLALTGTPIENRLTDLWSLFDFLNHGFLGSAAQFTHLAKQLRQHPQGYSPLRKIVTPFILRRVKTDKTVIQDLPDKIEMTARSALTRRQAALYLEVVTDLERKLQHTSGMERRGLVLASLMRLKQICTHPDQYLGRTDYAPAESGKFQRLKEIAEAVREKHERVLVFTQFREITEPLALFLESVFEHPGLVLHGQTPVSKRRQIVQTFQEDPQYVPFMVLSLKAGGVGLNLTRANHVVHFDRWWNPAVENQATDRAFRIGQTHHVLVHKFISQGTIEENIDRLIADKSHLSDEIIDATGETWIGDLDDGALMDLVRLQGGLVDVSV